MTNDYLLLATCYLLHTTYYILHTTYYLLLTTYYLQTESFNQDINTWDTSNVLDFRSAFRGASAFNVNLVAWDVTGAITTQGIFDDTKGLSDCAKFLTYLAWQPKLDDNFIEYSKWLALGSSCPRPPQPPFVPPTLPPFPPPPLLERHVGNSGNLTRILEEVSRRSDGFGTLWRSIRDIL